MCPSSSPSTCMFTQKAHTISSKNNTWWHKSKGTVLDASQQCKVVDMAVVMLGQSAQTVMQCNRTKASEGQLVVVSDVNQHAAPLRDAPWLKPALFLQLTLIQQYIQGMNLRPTTHLFSATHSLIQHLTQGMDLQPTTHLVSGSSRWAETQLQWCSGLCSASADAPYSSA